MNHFFVEIGKIRLELSSMQSRMDSLEEFIENQTLLSDAGYVQESSDTGTFGQPVNGVFEEQRNEGKDRADPDVIKKTMEMVLKSLSKEKRILRDTVKDFDDRLKDVETGNNFEERLHDLEDKLKGQPAHVNNPADKRVDVEGKSEFIV